MKKLIILASFFCFSTLGFSAPAFAADIFGGFTYSLAAEGTADRQIFNATAGAFNNGFDSRYKLSGGLGYFVGLRNEVVSLQYRISTEDFTRYGSTNPYRHQNILLMARQAEGARRFKMGIGYGTARSPSIGNAIISTDTNYDTTSYVFGVDFIGNGGKNFNPENRHFFFEYIATNAHSRTFRLQENNNDLGVREQIRYNQIIFGYIFNFSTIN